MGRTACTESQCLYKGDLYLYLTDDFYPYQLQLVQKLSSRSYHTCTVLLSGCNQGYKFSLISCYRPRLRAHVVVLTGQGIPIRWHIDIQMTSLQSNFQNRFPAGACRGICLHSTFYRGTHNGCLFHKYSQHEP